MSYAYTDNGQKVHDFIANGIDPVSFALIVIEFAEYETIHGAYYIAHKWHKFCDEIAEWLISSDSNLVGTIGLEIAR